MSFRTRRQAWRPARALGLLPFLPPALLLVLTGIIPPRASQSGATDLVTVAAADADARRQAYLDLTTTFRVLAIAAHPGDEDLATLAFCRRGQGVRVRIHHVTAGELGRPAAGAARGPALGVRRLVEAGRAAAVVGASATRSWLPDASGAPAWSKRDLLESLVRAIRGFRPHVVILRGEKAAAGEVESAAAHAETLAAARLAVEAAADRARFDDHLQDLLYPWKVSRLYVACNPSDADVALPVGDADPHFQATYAELGARARACYTTRPAPGGATRTHAYFRLDRPKLGPAAGVPQEGVGRGAGKGGRNNDGKLNDGKVAVSFFEGLVAFDQRELELVDDADYRRVREVEDRIIRTGFKLLEMGESDADSFSMLMESYRLLAKLNARPYLKRRLDVGEFIDEIGYQKYLAMRAPDLNRAILRALRVSLRTEAEAAPVAPGQAFQITARLSIASEATLENATLRIERAKSGSATYVEQSNRILRNDDPIHVYFKVRVAEDAPPTWPATEAFDHERMVEPMRCIITGRYGDEHLGLTIPIAVPPVAPPVQIRSIPPAIALEAGDPAATIKVEFRTQGPLNAVGGRPDKEPMIFNLKAIAPAGVAVNPTEIEVPNLRSGHPTYHPFEVTITPRSGTSGAPLGPIRFEAQRSKNGELVGPVYSGVVAIAPTVKSPPDEKPR